MEGVSLASLLDRGGLGGTRSLPVVATPLIECCEAAEAAALLPSDQYLFAR